MRSRTRMQNEFIINYRKNCSKRRRRPFSFNAHFLQTLLERTPFFCADRIWLAFYFSYHNIIHIALIRITRTAEFLYWHNDTTLASFAKLHVLTSRSVIGKTLNGSLSFAMHCENSTFPFMFEKILLRTH